jgi:multidrug resistance efflux pump
VFYGNGANVKAEIAQLDRQIDVAKARHQLSRQESASLESQVNRLQKLYRTYGRNGFSRAELRTLDNQVDNVKRDLVRQVNDRDNSGHNGRGYGHR